MSRQEMYSSIGTNNEVGEALRWGVRIEWRRSKRGKKETYIILSKIKKYKKRNGQPNCSAPEFTPVLANYVRQ